MFALPQETKKLQGSRVPPLRHTRNSQRLSVAAELCKLQLKQHGHDERYHQDIWCLPYNVRIKHMVLHFAKYAGKFQSAEEQRDRHLFTATLIDTWIITLASANILNLRLSQSLRVDDQDAPNLQELGDRITAEFAPTRDPYLLACRQLCKTVGLMAKACECMDHGEAFDSRGTLERGIVNVAKLSLVLANLLDVDLSPLVETRWKEIEAKSIF
ncbi:MAG: hypothetical protein ABL950_04280 [Nitrospira sp.]